MKSLSQPIWRNLHFYFFYLFLLSIPFQTRKVFLIEYSFYSGAFTEWTTVFLYASDVFLILALAFWLISVLRSKNYQSKQGSAQLLNYYKNKIYSCFVIPAKAGIQDLTQKTGFKNIILTVFQNLLEQFLKIVKKKWLFLYIFLVWLVLNLIINREYFEISAFHVAKFIELSFLMIFVYFNLQNSKVLVNSLFVLAFSGFLQSLIAIYQFIAQHSAFSSPILAKITGESIVSPQIPGVAKIVVDGEKIIRAYGTFPHPNVLGGFLIFTILITIYLYLEHKNDSLSSGKLGLSALISQNCADLTRKNAEILKFLSDKLNLASENSDIYAKQRQYSQASPLSALFTRIIKSSLFYNIKHSKSQVYINSIFWTLFLSAQFIGLFFTFSRSAWLGLLLSLFIISVFYFFNYNNVSRETLFDKIINNFSGAFYNFRTSLFFPRRQSLSSEDSDEKASSAIFLAEVPRQRLPRGESEKVLKFIIVSRETICKMCQIFISRFLFVLSEIIKKFRNIGNKNKTIEQNLVYNLRKSANSMNSLLSILAKVSSKNSGKLHAFLSYNLSAGQAGSDKKLCQGECNKEILNTANKKDLNNNTSLFSKLDLRRVGRSGDVARPARFKRILKFLSDKISFVLNEGGKTFVHLRLARISKLLFNKLLTVFQHNFCIKSIIKYKELFIALIIIIFVIGINLPLVSSRLDIDLYGGSPTFNNSAINERVFYNNVSRETILNNFIFGSGVGTFIFQIDNYLQANNISQKLQPWQYQPAHNIYLLIAPEIGITGLILFLSLIVSVLYRLLLNNFNIYAIQKQNVNMQTSVSALCVCNKINSSVGATNKIVSRETISNDSLNIYLFATLIAFLFIGLFDHYFWTLQQGRLMFWLVLGLMLAVSDYKK